MKKPKANTGKTETLKENETSKLTGHDDTGNDTGNVQANEAARQASDNAVRQSADLSRDNPRAAREVPGQRPATGLVERPMTGPMSSEPAPEGMELPPIRLGPGQVTGGGAVVNGQAGAHKEGSR
ncbi:MAG: hypothetical protein V4773_11960 [Verrucomicrobiota bacterium]